MTESVTETPQNLVTVFQLDGQPVRGRAVTMESALNEALGKRYPDLVARLLGEAMLISAIVAQSLKFDGRLVIQCHGTNSGAVSLLMSDCTTEGHIRGYARWDETRLKELKLDNRNPGAEDLLGGGTFSMTIDQGPDMDQYQGLAAIEGARLSDCAEHYFRQSEQIPTEIRLVCGQLQEPGKDPVWRGGGIMIQKIAEDKTRGDTDEAWETARALFQTVSETELLDPDLSQNDLLYRLFHEDGVRVVETSPIEAKCKCSRERLENTLRSFEKEALADMAENGMIEANCEFCDTTYEFAIADLQEIRPKD